jgi:Cu+-exporting ATPase
MASVDVLIVDKAGTLTEGRRRMTDTISLGTFAEGMILSLAAVLTLGSEHPRAEASVDDAKVRGVAQAKATDFVAVTVKG